MSHFTVYWVKYPDDDDPYSQGYIGMTGRDIKERLSAHRFTFVEQFKHGAIIVPLHENLTRRTAKKLELSYRPKANIGWNTRPGNTNTSTSKYVNKEGVAKQLFNIRMESDLYQDMKEYADTHDMTMTDFIVETVKKAIYT